jgi:hypothetical protein
LKFVLKLTTARVQGDNVSLRPPPTSEAALDALEVPAEFARHEHIVDSDVLARLDEWKNKAYDDLVLLQNSGATTPPSVSQQAPRIFAAVFRGEDCPWIMQRSLNAS